MLPVLSQRRERKREREREERIERERAITTHGHHLLWACQRKWATPTPESMVQCCVERTAHSTLPFMLVYTDHSQAVTSEATDTG